MTEPNADGRVTLAVLGTKLDELLRRVEQMCAEHSADMQDHETRLRILERNERVEQILREIDDRSKRNEQRLGVFAGLQAAFTAIGTGLAAWLGIRN